MAVEDLTDAMSGSDFEQFIAGLCHRDGFTVLQRRGGAGDLGADALDGRRIVMEFGAAKAKLLG
jgi:restriction system protein